MRVLLIATSPRKIQRRPRRPWCTDGSIVEVAYCRRRGHRRKVDGKARSLSQQVATGIPNAARSSEIDRILSVSGSIRIEKRR